MWDSNDYKCLFLYPKKCLFFIFKALKNRNFGWNFKFLIGKNMLFGGFIACGRILLKCFWFEKKYKKINYMNSSGIEKTSHI